MTSPARLALLPLLLCWLEAPARGDLPPLIPREVLFGNPERIAPQISPDGRRLSWIAPDKNNVLQVFVKTIGRSETADDRQVTADRKRGIRRYLWARDNHTLLYLQDSDGDENFHVYGVDLVSSNVRDYTPFQDVRAEIAAVEPGFPDEVLVALNLRDRRLLDIYRLTLSTGALLLDTQNPGDVVGWAADPRLQVRAAQVKTPDGGTEIRVRADRRSPWKSWLKAGPEENLDILDFSGDGRSLTLLSSLGSDTTRVVERGLQAGAEASTDRVLASSVEADAEEALVHPRTHVVQAALFAPGRARWTVIDPAVKADFAGIEKLHDGDFSIINRDEKDRTWLLAFTSDRGPVRYYAWDRQARAGTFLFVNRPRLESARLAEMKPVAISSRDGLTLNGYLTLPVGIPAQRLPLVLYVHGGPWDRDRWGLDATAQWFANRGYACLQVNYRGSTGYGKKFLNAGDREWGRKMHDDLIDAVSWAVKEGLADPRRVAIFGGSYGGYAALSGVTFTPEFFACAVDLVGPSSLPTFINAIPPYWKPMRTELDRRVGNIDDPKDADLLHEASPLFRAHLIVRPLLIGQGQNDPRVKQAESEQIVEAIRKHGGKVTYVLYPDEGHGFARPENRLDFDARAEAFLKGCLGGRLEPLQGERYPGSTAVVRVVSKAAP